jgi:transcription elongation factor GreA
MDRLMTESTQLSRAAHDRLSSELKDLSTRGRIDIAQKIEEARLLGDLSENGDYHAAKEEQGKMEGRIRHLEALLQDATIIEGPTGELVEHGVTVEIRYEGDDETERYLYGSIEEAGGDAVLTPGSPLGAALAGCRVGDRVDFETPSGATLAVEIVAIEV